MYKIYFCSFADSSIKKSLVRISEQAKEMNIFDDIETYTEKELPKYGKKRIKEILKKTNKRRGYGYWAWKPIIINQSLSKMQENDILIYSDAGNHLNKNGRDKLLNYINEAIKNDIWVIKLGDENADYRWTKNDLIDFFKQKYIKKEQLLSFEEKLYSGQFEAGTIILKKNNYTMSIIKQWESIMTIENCHFFDDSPSITPNNSEFNENRHDQSVFSLLLKGNHCSYTDLNHFEATSEQAWNKLRKDEPFLRLRDIPRIERKPSLMVRVIRKIRTI